MGQDRVEGKSMIDLVLVKKDMLDYVQDEGSERNGMSSLRSPCCTVNKVRLVGHELRGER